jgi:hypothetical protein
VVNWIKSRSKTFWWAMGLAAVGIFSQLDPSSSTYDTWPGRFGGAAMSAVVVGATPYAVRAIWNAIWNALRTNRERQKHRRAVAQNPPPPVVVHNYTSGLQSAAQQPFVQQPNPHVLWIEELHTWVREGARPFWGAGHYRQAVEESARRINHEIQVKVGRKDVSERALIQDVFSQDIPKPGIRRLRPPGDRGTDTWRSRLHGMRDLGFGCFAGIRNVAAHQAYVDWDRTYAFHLLAAFSLFATWVDECEIDRID